MRSTRLTRTTLIMLSLTLLGIGVYSYYRIGSFVYEGSFGELPVHRWEPYSFAIISSMVSIMSGFIIYALSRRPHRKSVVVASILAIISLVLVVASSGSYLVKTDYYVLRTPITTDSYVLQVEAAKVLLRGENPYEHNYREALLQNIPPDPYTWIYRDNEPPYTTEEITGFVDRFDYLAPAALYYVPAVALGLPPYVWDSIVVALGFAIVFWRMPWDSKHVFAAIVSLGIFIYIAPLLGKTTIAGWAIPLMVAVSFMDRPIIAGPLLAWASTYRIYPAFFALFYLVAQHKEGYKAGRTLLYATIAGLILNLPFLLWNPRLYVESFLIPYKLNLNPLDMGPGLSSLGYLGYYIPKTVSTALVMGVTLIGLAVSWLYYPRLKHAIFLFPAIAMFLYYRPSYIYYIYFPYLGFIAYISNRISYLDEKSKISVKNAILLSGVVLASSLSAALEVVELVPDTEIHRFIVITISLLTPVIIPFIWNPSRLELSDRSYTTIVFLLAMLAGAGAGLISKTYYIVYDLARARELLVASANGLTATGPVRSVVQSIGEPIIPSSALALAPDYVAPRLSPAAALVVRALGPVGASTVLIAILLAVSLAVAIALYRRSGSIIPILALVGAPSLYVGPTGLQVQEYLLLAGLLTIVMGYLGRGTKRLILAGIGAVIVSLSVPLGPLIAAASLVPLLRETVDSRVLLVSLVVAGSILSVILDTGFFDSYTYMGFCLCKWVPLGSLEESIIRVAMSLPLLVVDILLGAGLWVSSLAPGILAGHSCSLHAIAVLLYASLFWALVTGTRARILCVGERRGC